MCIPACESVLISRKLVAQFSLRLQNRVSVESASSAVSKPVAAIRSQCWQLSVTSSIYVNFRLRGKKKEREREKGVNRGAEKMKKRLGRQIGRQRKGKKSQREARKKRSREKCKREQRRERMKRGEARETERRKREHLAASHNANTLQSIAAKVGSVSQCCREMGF